MTRPLPPGIMVAAAASGCGKTTVALGLMAAFRAQGLAVQAFKNGPDYIDPAFHAAASGRVACNLDTWAMGRGQISALMEWAQGADLVVAEGSMGLYDGVAMAGESGIGASAELAIMAGWPVVLVLDCGGQAQTAAAVAAGLAGFDPALPVAGVVLNRVASPRHEALLRRGMQQAGLAVFGALPRQADIEIPERHLGLVQAEEREGLNDAMAAFGQFIVAHLDLDAIRRAAGAAPQPAPVAHRLPPPADRIALARDAAFSFVYPHLLREWRDQGATILPFSPLADEAPDDSAGACWLPGGYPELHAGRLAAADRFRDGLTRFAQTRPVHGECGGYMALGAGLVDAEGKRHRMAGLLGLETSFEKRRMHLGYRHARLLAPMPGLSAGTSLRGHEFHYARILTQPDAPLAQVQDATGTALADGEHGSVCDHVTGSFFHLIAGSA
ncbi:MAG: cobyrinate a,c-diamide synthase [Paracoccus sp. (in: a-proteobacteria)]|uniref:cobyrinate a,c-diamide synthase n=1 Tax=Paracoccus sp. TaxID=267 RepID=UPI0026E01AA1|nr:cobyrinate a,c-diamide synthase [Paracoccus sp. (in: a-proteobacteria)]MDO5621000.1 cobyrinate a,c-diamide synthase [Paracoccus sp. (in: a-proteobacteria)]